MVHVDSQSTADAMRLLPRRLIAAGIVLVMMVVVCESATASPRFVARDNPFAYVGEYRDPLWSGVYLRARWYHPPLASFVSRDPLSPHINRYGYAGGNPLMHIDLSGMSYRAGTGWLRAGLGDLNRGVGGHFARFVLGQFLVPLQILASPASFWRALDHDTGGTAVFLVAGAALEAASYVGMYWGAARTLTTSTGSKLFWTRLLGESGLGSGQALTSSFSGHFHHFDRDRLIQGLELIGGPELLDRVAAGIGYQPFNLDWGDVLRLTRDNSDRDTALVFRVRQHLPEDRATWTTPWQERANIGIYHAKLLAITPESFMETEFYQGINFGKGFFQENLYERFMAPEGPCRFEYVGRVSRARAEQALSSNPSSLYTRQEQARYEREHVRTRGRFRYDKYRRNCQTHVRLILDQLGGG